MRSDELRFVNAFLGFCTYTGFWPAPFAHLDYQMVGVEKEILTILGGKPKRVVPELICASTQTNHVFCLEAKSTSVNILQASAYVAITPQQIVALGLLPAGYRPATLSHDTIYVSLPTNAPTLAQRMANQSISLPIVAGDATRFVLIQGNIGQTDLQAVLQHGIDILPDHQWPTHFVQFNSEVPDSELAAPVINGLARFLLRPMRFTAEDVAAASIQHWQWCGTEEQNRFRNKIHELIDRTQREELQPYFRPASPPRRVRPARNVVWQPNHQRPMNAQRIAAFMRDATSFVNRQQTDTPYVPGQPRLTGL